MLNTIKSWFASKRGKDTVITVLALALTISILGQVVGWSNIGRLITGTTGPGEGGYSCMPTCDETDGKFLSMPGEDMASFGGARIVLWVEAPIGQSSFDIGIFDGDAGLDVSGEYGVEWTGNWDNTATETTYTLYVDPERDGPPEDGSGEIVLGRWLSNQDNPTSGPLWSASSARMPNNAWYDITVRNTEDARGSDGKYYYRLEITRPIEGWGINAFKLRSTGQITSGRSDIVDANFAIVGMLANLGDVSILYPEFDGDLNNPGPSIYTGDWEFYFDVPAGTKTISFWDGDFDRGTSASADADTDDPNTKQKPKWALPSAREEGAGGKGYPADDYNHPIYRIEPPIYYEVIGPDGKPVFVNEEPSGTEEWEKFVVTSLTEDEMPDDEMDLRVGSIPPGLYTLHIGGLDLHNTVWFRINYEISDTPPDDCPECPICPEPEPTQECEVYPTNTPEPTPEPTETPIPPEPTVCPDPQPIDLVYVLDVSGSMDQLYPGSGKKLEAAQEAIYALNDLVKTEGAAGSRVALGTFHSAGRGRGRPPVYPTDIKLVSEFTTDIDAFNAKVAGLDASGGTPTGEALQKLAAWLPGAWDPNHLPVVILISDGVPTVDLETYGFQDYDVQVIDLYDDEGNFRSIADVRDSGKRYDQYGQRAGEPLADAMEQVNGLVSAMPDVTVHTIAVQATHQGIFNDGILKYLAAQGGGEFYTAEDTDGLKESLRRAYFTSACGEQEPPGGESPPEDESSACTDVRRNQYNVENTTNRPFHSIKYEFESGDEIERGEWDEFSFTLSKAEAEALSEVTIEAKAGRAWGRATLSECDFAGADTCGPVSARRFGFSFQGATDNGSSVTLTFRVTNNRRRGLSHVAIGLPREVKPIWPENSFQSEVCLD
jgi:uncharacterized protein YegL